MPTYQVQSIVEGQPCFEKPLDDILSDLKEGGAIKTLSALEYHTDRQRRWVKGVCLKRLSDWSGDTPEEWDLRLKALCGGNELLNRETIYLGPGTTCKRLTIVGVGKKNLTAYIENILSKAIEMDWTDTEGNPIVPPPDPDLRKQ